MRVLFDTNILTRLANAEQPEWRDIAKRAVGRVVEEGCIPCLLPQNLYEFWTVATRPANQNRLGMPTAEARDEVDALLQFFHLLQDERAIFRRWIDLVTTYDVKGKTAHDARLVAGMLRHGLNYLVTFNDKEFARYLQISTYSPVDIASGEASMPRA